ncbi:hypothetical protein PPERSA_05489 [Pseudocohnilembus persalinus]|uniref:Ceramidase n=1 Tax=Pseudocohnilembus persalinus TaxID=266149 RepID=A0A0V0QCT4_PSEPJ|nr:hypothetical protein PPERSA_05489 [Pseudocohnilembus persalinus]|eukprot:KRW99986.1 hypothetical protein PPERSA_05489 [Pseudocohnilembus persalinus]
MSQNIDLQVHSKYGYTHNEKVAMAILTALTNFWQIPGCQYMWCQKRYPHFALGLFTMVTSFMYHLLDSLDVEEFFIDQGSWHRLDNLGAICCFVLLMIEFMHFKDRVKEEKLFLLGLFIIIILQEGYPWNIEFTLIPIFIFLGILLQRYLNQFKKIVKDYHPQALKRGLIYLCLAIFCFAKGLDEFIDYLRFFHGMWHTFVTFAFFYVFQIHKSKEEQIDYFSQSLLGEHIKITVI